MYYPRFTKVIIHYFMNKDPLIPRRNTVNWHNVRDDQMFTTIKLVLRDQNTQQFGVMLPIELTNEDIKNTKTYKEYYVVASGAAPLKTKASVRRTKSSFDTSITPVTVIGIRLSTSTKGKQPAKASKAKSLIVVSEVAMTEAELLKLATKRSLQQTHISQASGSGADEGTGIIPGVPDDNVVQDDDDQDEGNDNDQDIDNEGDEFVHPKLSIHEEEETKDEESFDPIAQTPENSDDEGNDDASLGLNGGSKEGQDSEDDEYELYRDVNINLGRDVQMTDVHTTQEFEDTHVTLTPINPDGQQQIQQAPTPPTTAPSIFLQDLPNFGSLFGFDHRLKTLEAKLSEFVQTNQFAGAVSSILKIVQRYMDQWMNEAVKIPIEKMESNKSIHRSDEQRNLYKSLVEAYDSDKIILDTYGDTITLKRHCNDADKDEEPSAGLDQWSKRRREGKEPESTSTPKEKATKTTGKSTQGSKSHQKTASESTPAEEPMHRTQDLEEPSHQEFKTGAADDQPIAEASQHPKWFQQQKKHPTPDRA
uniref:Uncharacterized protein n=1 Tax=Tanacetum cinerariifolium TaxID=118510 RepID=A0A699KJJ8_TANCI|nr:hypothetical protein [Tanacetum cinerariifolium]